MVHQGPALLHPPGTSALWLQGDEAQRAQASGVSGEARILDFHARLPCFLNPVWAKAPSTVLPTGELRTNQPQVELSPGTQHGP